MSGQPGLFDSAGEAVALLELLPEGGSSSSSMGIEGYQRVGRYAVRNPATGDCIAKLVVRDEPGYLAWLCAGQGTGWRGADQGGWLSGCWSTAAEAAQAIERVRQGGEELAQGP